MTSFERAVVFRLIDDYSRNKHQCFVAEFDFDEADNDYRLCFRPTGGTKDSPRYACRYLHIGIRCIMEAAETKELPASMTEQLDRELPSLGQLV
jgi:hypothetical protein